MMRNYHAQVFWLANPHKPFGQFILDTSIKISSRTLALPDQLYGWQEDRAIPNGEQAAGGFSAGNGHMQWLAGGIDG